MNLSIHVLLFTCSTIFNSNQDMKKVEVGSIIPQFPLKDQNGNLFTIDSVLGK
jgi:hypothetical protein